MTDIIQSIKHLQAVFLAMGLAFVAAVTSAFLPVSADVAVPVVVFLSVGSAVGFAFTWLRAEAALKSAEKVKASVTSNYVLLANRLIRLEQQLRIQAPAEDVAAKREEQQEEKSALKIVPEQRLQPAPQPSVAHVQPEPSLLPFVRLPTEEDAARMRLVMQAFESDRIELHLQPVVALPQRKIRFYEALARLRLVDGTLLGPTEFLPVIERLGRAPDFDRRVLERAMTVARHFVARGSEAIIGVNLSPRSIDEQGFLWSLTGLMETAPEILGRIVLELPQEAWQQLDTDRKSALAALRDRGVPLSLDRAADLSFDARGLADCGIRFVKLPAELMIAAAQNEDRHLGSELGVRDFAPVLRREGIRLIADRVEREEMVPVLAELGVPLAQGFVFAAPRAIKAEVLGEAAGSGAAMPPMRRAG